MSKCQKRLVDVTGIEPVTPCLQNSPTTSCKPRHFNQSIEKSNLKSVDEVCADVRRCGLLHVGSLQKSLQSTLTDMVVAQ
jgi:hypothetical protein